MARYQVNWPVKMPDGSIVGDGVVELDEARAAGAVAAGALTPLESSSGSEQERELEEVVMAIEALSPDDPGNWTADGRPALPVLSEALGRRISAALRDAAWLLHNTPDEMA